MEVKRSEYYENVDADLLGFSGENLRFIFSIVLGVHKIQEYDYG